MWGTYYATYQRPNRQTPKPFNESDIMALTEQENEELSKLIVLKFDRSIWMPKTQFDRLYKLKKKKLKVND